MKLSSILHALAFAPYVGIAQGRIQVSTRKEKTSSPFQRKRELNERFAAPSRVTNVFGNVVDEDVGGEVNWNRILSESSLFPEPQCKSFDLALECFLSHDIHVSFHRGNHLNFLFVNTILLIA